MIRRWLWAGAAPVLAGAALLLTPSTSHAWGHGWGGWGGGWGGWYGPYYTSYGGPAWSGYPYYSNYGWTTPSYGYYGSYWSPYYTYPSYTASTYTYPSPSYANPAYYVSYSPATGTNGANNRNDAWVQVEVPANAEVWFGGFKTSQTGTDRLFYTPPLNPKNNYSYQVRARWTENGRVVDRTRHVPVQAGQTVTVDFLKAETSRQAVSTPEPTAATPPAVPRGEMPTNTGPTVR